MVAQPPFDHMYPVDTWRSQLIGAYPCDHMVQSWYFVDEPEPAVMTGEGS